MIEVPRMQEDGMQKIFEKRCTIEKEWEDG